MELRDFITERISLIFCSMTESLILSCLRSWASRLCLSASVTLVLRLSISLLSLETTVSWERLPLPPLKWPLEGVGEKSSGLAETKDLSLDLELQIFND